MKKTNIIQIFLSLMFTFSMSVVHAGTRTIESRIRSVLAYSFNVDESDVTPEKNLFKDLGGDNYDLISLSNALKSEFGVELSFEQMTKFKTVQSINEFYRKLAAANPVVAK